MLPTLIGKSESTVRTSEKFTTRTSRLARKIFSWKLLEKLYAPQLYWPEQNMMVQPKEKH
jgi:hypothetical protein